MSLHLDLLRPPFTIRARLMVASSGHHTRSQPIPFSMVANILILLRAAAAKSIWPGLGGNLLISSIGRHITSAVPMRGEAGDLDAVSFML